ncbi:LuxR family transcriptional regulator [Ensifer adhaerens]|uniref:LuxR family transcriptional regulator n=1 Tax=Ensifer adhaerens TaxID=106592 RepID=UPI000CF04FAE|nr:LuxR family transcriptional regulator [Ensifer adhaerens]
MKTLLLSERFEELMVELPDKGLPDILALAIGEFGINRFAYFPTANAAQDPKPEILTNYCDPWVTRYRTQNYQLIDPAVLAGSSSFMNVDWSEFQNTPEVSKFFGEAMEFGVSPIGLTIPIRDPENRRALFSVNADINAREWPAFKKSFQADLTYLSFLFHKHLVARRADLAPVKAQLSRRERQVLSWAALGKTTWETACILKLSQRTVEFYLRNCCAQLGVANKTQAVAVALCHGLVTLLPVHSI